MNSITTGVPRGSILGPLLLLIYINDMHNVSKKFHFLCYADDTTLLGSIKDFDSNNLSEDINTEISKFNDWLKINKLSLNASKTKYMIFHKQGKFLPKIDIKISEVALEAVKNFTFLGLTIDASLTWQPHLNRISNKLTKICNILTKLKNFLPSNILLTIYNALILPHINYGILTWGFVSTNRLFRLQKKAIRLITKSKTLAHTGPIFKSLGLLKIDDILLRFLLKFCFKYHHNNLPEYFKSFAFIHGVDVHGYETRSRNQLRPELLRKTFTEKRVKIAMIKVLNYASESNTNPAHYQNITTSFLNNLYLKPSRTIYMIVRKIQTHSLHSLRTYIKRTFIDSYNEYPCTITDCISCKNEAFYVLFLINAF